MGFNIVQFQPGLSMTEFVYRYGIEASGRGSDNKQPFVITVQVDHNH